MITIEEFDDDRGKLDPDALIAKGWRYEDFPKIRADFWAELLAVIGRENFRALTLARYETRDGIYERGQLLISPQGIENIRAHYPSAAPPRAQG